MAQGKRATRVDVGKLAKRVRKAVDEGTDAAERIHKRAVNLPLDVLERNGMLGSTAKDLRRFQDQTIGAVYDLVRGINHEVRKLADTVVRSPLARRRRARNRPPRRGMKTAGATRARKTAAA
jgi:hypothetical protein